MKEQFDISTSKVFSANEGSPMNILYNDFAEGSRAVSSKIIAITKNLREILQQLPAEYADDMMDNISLLCLEYQREGFFAGVRTGIKLINEIRT